jgi:hypothetical protein
MGRSLARLAVVAALIVACAGQVPVVSPTAPAATPPAAMPSPRPTIAPPTPTVPPFGELPPVRFTLSGRGLVGTWTDIFSYAGRNQGRVDVPRSTVPGHDAGDFLVWDGRRFLWYRAAGRTYSFGGTEPGTHALDVLFLDLVWSRTAGVASCPDRRVLEEVMLLERRAIHIACAPNAIDWWVDIETGLILRSVYASSGGITREVTKLEFRPTFPAGTFDTSPPRGATESSP